MSEVIKRMYEADNVRVSLIPIRNEKTLLRVYYSKGDETELVLEKVINAYSEKPTIIDAKGEKYE